MEFEPGEVDHETRASDGGEAADPLVVLVVGNTLATDQVALIHEMWRESTDVTWGHPRLRAVREHTRAYAHAAMTAAA